MIEFESVGKTFKDGTAAVVDLSLTVPSDQITVIVGPSGCGKTTTLRMVNRMIEPTSGRISWDGNPLRSKRKTALRRQMGYVIQSGGLFPHRTVLDNIGTVPGLLGWSKTKIQKRSMELLGSVGLDRALAHRYPAQLSGGQQQRVGVARALAADPMVLLMDEPFSAVDPVVRSELHEFFLGLQRELSKTIILITHDIDEAIKLGDQVAILRVGGHLAQVGSPQQLLDEPADAFVDGFIGRDRGYRSLSFLPTSTLTLDRVQVVRDVLAVRGGEPTLVVDDQARPLGWADPAHPGQVFALGSTFKADDDTLRIALDSALTSPFGLAVAVDSETGRFAGVVDAQTILGQITDARSAVAESISVREAAAERSLPAATPPVEETQSGSDQRPDLSSPESTVDEPAVDGTTVDEPVPDEPVPDEPGVDDTAAGEASEPSTGAGDAAVEPRTVHDPPRAEAEDDLAVLPESDAPEPRAKGSDDEAEGVAPGVDGNDLDSEPRTEDGDDTMLVGPLAVDPTPADSVPADPAPNDPAPNDPAPNDPAPNDPAPNDPAPNDPAPNDPALNDLTPADPEEFQDHRAGATALTSRPTDDKPVEAPPAEQALPDAATDDRWQPDDADLRR